MSNAIGSSRESNPSRRICHLRAVPLGHADICVAAEVRFLYYCYFTIYSVTDLTARPLPSHLRLLFSVTCSVFSFSSYANHISIKVSNCLHEKNSSGRKLHNCQYVELVLKKFLKYSQGFLRPWNSKEQNYQYS